MTRLCDNDAPRSSLAGSKILEVDRVGAQLIAHDCRYAWPFHVRPVKYGVATTCAFVSLSQQVSGTTLPAFGFAG